MLNAANEIAVDLFLHDALPFTSIPDIVEGCLEKLGDDPITSLDDVYLVDVEARRVAGGLAPRFTG